MLKARTPEVLASALSRRSVHAFAAMRALSAAYTPALCTGVKSRLSSSGNPSACLVSGTLNSASLCHYRCEFTVRRGESQHVDFIRRAPRTYAHAQSPGCDIDETVAI